ncbi:hypothetical protein BABINDRAFT_5675 [Babjeviella inositovora NRRL Y-12698]|uniref:Acyl-CoA dehydrogenase/oxidase C-terminal domain-containing protein n=1 Tax=Babjeviella inositovora NRRL Y-12698 TaxID=984486 RepID=A0A1E3R062_9ASCO|nr:uncharacterized protein BABINDRAFT_5675 [Babjeviella inositovora NRRL Y-12698]ODQ82757.1 hypothetical protein BABINDRAFT_5675 [Babjeviella inositovora NRRL Y-12698]
MPSEDLQIPLAFLDKISPRGLETIKKVKHFVETECIPADEVYLGQLSTDPATRWSVIPPIIEELKAKAQKLGLWNLFLCNNYEEYGAGFTNLEYGLMAQQLGRSHTGPEATNTAAPDTGNTELLVKYGSVYHKEKYLKPLLEGKIRSAFLMTEKGTSSSNALNICCSAVRKGDNFVLNGVKWFASGAGDPRAAVWLTMCQTAQGDLQGPAQYTKHSVLVLDVARALASGRAKVIRPLQVFGMDDAPHGHCEIVFDNYVVPVENAVLGSVGQGFEIIQSRLGPGRIHHCMRVIGLGEQALLHAYHRASNRKIAGDYLSNSETWRYAFGEHKITLEQCRMLVLNAAHAIDHYGVAKHAQRDIAMAKIVAPREVIKIVDWCIQVFGAEGVSQDTPLARMWMHSRTLRIADGPDESHLNQFSRNELRKLRYVNDAFAASDRKTKELIGAAKL